MDQAKKPRSLYSKENKPMHFWSTHRAQTNRTYPVLIALMVLTFLSSCGTRKSIEAQFDLPVTKQLNPSKTTLSGSHTCEYDEIDWIAAAPENGSVEHTQAAVAIPGMVSFFDVQLGVSKIVLLEQGQKIPGKTPLYILYQKRKLGLA